MTDQIAVEMQFQSIPVSLLAPSAENRKAFDDDALQELAQSIKTEGVIEPIIVRKKDGGELGYEIIAGERRFRAAKVAGLQALPAVVRQATDAEARTLRLVENVQREDLTLAEQCDAVEKLLELMPLDEVCAKLGKSKPWVSKRGTVKDLPEPVRQAVAKNVIKDVEIASGIGELHEVNKAKAVEMLERVAGKHDWKKAPDRKELRETVSYEKENKKARAEMAKSRAKANKKAGADKAAIDRKIAHAEHLQKSAETFTETVNKVVCEKLGVAKPKGGWRSGDPFELSQDQEFEYRPYMGFDGNKFPANIGGASFALRATGSASHLTKITAALGFVPQLEINLPERIPLEVARKLEEALKGTKGFSLSIAINRSGKDVAGFVKRLTGQEIATEAVSPLAEGEPVPMFLVDHTTKVAGGMVKSAELYKKYCAWSKAKKQVVLDVTAFGNAISKSGIGKKRLNTGWHYIGIGLKA